MADKRVYDDDDGRTIADMSGLERPSAFLPRRRKNTVPPSLSRERGSDRPWEPDEGQMSKEDRRVYVFAALRAALLIAAVFIVGLGLGIWLLLRLWS